MPDPSLRFRPSLSITASDIAEGRTRACKLGRARESGSICPAAGKEVFIPAGQRLSRCSLPDGEHL